MKVGDKVKLLVKKYESYGFYHGHIYEISGIDLPLLNLTRNDNQTPVWVYCTEIEFAETPRVTSNIYDNSTDISKEDLADMFKSYTAIVTDTDIGPKSARHNTGKINPIELDPSFIMGMAEVLTKSRVKYPEFNWALPTKLSTPYQSLFRHLMAFQSGEDFDPEDGCHHMLKVAVNAMFIHYHSLNNNEESDDRFFKKDK